MKKYIERDEFVKRLNENVELTNPEEQEWVKDECIRQAHAMPSVNVGEWIRAEERSPGVIGKYICCVKNKDGNTWTITADYSPEMKTWFGQFGEVRNTVTHWMPLPEPPKES